MAIEYGIMRPLIALINPSTPSQFMRNIAWTLSNLCRNKDPPPPSEVTKVTLPVFCQLVHHTDKEALSDACWALSYLSDGVNEKIQQVVESNVIPKLTELLDHDHISILSPTLRTEAAWTVSNIAAGNPQQIRALIDAQILPPLIKCLTEGDLKTKKEAMWSVDNICSAQVSALLEFPGASSAVCDLLKMTDVPLILVTLDGITHMLNMASEIGELDRLALAIEECGALDIIEGLQQRENNQVYKNSIGIINKYFSAEDVDDILPSGNSDQYEFQPTVPGRGYNF